MREIPLNPGVLRRAQDGEAQAITMLYERYGPLVYRVALRLTASEADAEDVVQDVFIGLPEALKSFEGRGAFSTWLTRVAERRTVTALRHKVSRSEVSIDQVKVQALPANVSDVDAIIAVENLLERLPQLLRTVVVLHDIEGYTHERIAHQLGVKSSTIRVRYYRALKLLKGLFSGTQ